MTTIRAALYAPLSPANSRHTIESQTAALRERGQSDGIPVAIERQLAPLASTCEVSGLMRDHKSKKPTYRLRSGAAPLRSSSSVTAVF
jgi:hypothetical protein